MEIIRDWFDQLPPQEERRSVTFELPDGSGAPSSDTLVVPTSIEADRATVTVVLDDWVELRFHGLGSVEPVSEGRLDLSDFEQLRVSWRAENPPAPRVYREGAVRFLSGHRLRHSTASSLAGARWETPL